MWARIENGVVAEVTDIDPAERFCKGLNWVSCPGDTVPNMVYADGKFTALPEAQVDYPALFAAVRYQHETAGIIVNGVPIDTGRDSQALITGAALSAMLDSSYVCNWKTPDGPIELNAQALIMIAQQVRVRVQACFDREFELLAALADKTYADDMLEEGWPA